MYIRSYIVCIGEQEVLAEDAARVVRVAVRAREREARAREKDRTEALTILAHHTNAIARHTGEAADHTNEVARYTGEVADHTHEVARGRKIERRSRAHF